jgi:hypothetical protein
MFIHLAVDQACQHVGELRHTIDRLGFRTETRRAWPSGCP